MSRNKFTKQFFWGEREEKIKFQKDLDEKERYYIQTFKLNTKSKKELPC